MASLLDLLSQVKGAVVACGCSISSLIRLGIGLRRRQRVSTCAMGNKLSYCERRCQICAVSFRVTRIPTPEERDAQRWHARDAAPHAAALQALQRNDDAGYDGSLISEEEMKVSCLRNWRPSFVPTRPIEYVSDLQSKPGNQHPPMSPTETSRFCPRRRRRGFRERLLVLSDRRRRPSGSIHL